LGFEIRREKKEKPSSYSSRRQREKEMRKQPGKSDKEVKQQ
jgi:hypothetical protein